MLSTAAAEGLELDMEDKAAVDDSAIDEDTRE
jgi:hypothetical protein